MAEGYTGDDDMDFSHEERAKLEKLHHRKDPVTILVIGPTGSGKSTLINEMFEEKKAEVGHGATSTTTKMVSYEGECRGIRVKIYDTIGFRDTGGKSDDKILMDIAKQNKFDLILICSKLIDKGDRTVFEELASVLNEEMWKRTVVVLTFANQFSILESVVEKGPEGEIKKNIEDYKNLIVNKFLDKKVKKEISQEIPLCIAGSKIKKIPTKEDWLKELWDVCICRCSSETRPFLKCLARYRTLLKIGAGASTGTIIGAGVGAGIGTVIPGIGNAIGAGIGAGMGGVIGGSVPGIQCAIKRITKK